MRKPGKRKLDMILWKQGDSLAIANQQEIRLEERVETRQYHLIRDEHDRMKKVLESTRTYFHNHQKKHPETDVVETLKLIDFLDHVLEFSSTWNGVETQLFFPPIVLPYLQANNMMRLGEFFARPFTEVSKELRARGSEYPFLLKKFYEAYFLRRSVRAKALPTMH